DEETAAIATRALAAARVAGDRRLPEARPASPPRVDARAGRDYLEVAWKGRFVPLFVKGVNLGVALPGRFPSEFPEDAATYRAWRAHIAPLGATAGRVYPRLPPAFYRALRDRDDAVVAAHPDAAAPPPGYLWLFQGVWTELPDEDRYDDPAFSGAFREEIDRI